MKIKIILLAVLMHVIGCGPTKTNTPDGVGKMSTKSFSIDKCYPYIVPEGYVPYVVKDGLLKPFGHGLHIMLVRDLDGVVQNVSSEDLQSLNMSGSDAHKTALDNLDRLFASGEIATVKFSNGPNNFQFIVVGEHWAAAACILLPNVRKLAQQKFGQNEILACIPHRDTMLIFPKPKDNDLSVMRKLVMDKESDGRKPLTFEFFELTESGPIPFSPTR